MNGGEVAQRGFRIQSIVTLLAAFGHEARDWDELEAEVESNNDKIDYGFYKEGRLIIVAQVKSTQNAFSKSDIEKWLSDLYYDKPDADEYVLVLAGNINKGASDYINNINKGNLPSNIPFQQKVQINQKPNNIADLIKIYRHDLYEFISANTIMNSMPPHILNDVAALLENEFQTLVTSRSRWTHKDIVEFLSQKLQHFVIEADNKYTPLSVITFERAIKNTLKETSKGNCLDLRELFEGRFLKEGYSWNDIIQYITNFVNNLDTDVSYKLAIEAGYTVSFALGRLMDGKSGLNIHYVQKTLQGTQIWDIDSGESISKVNCKHIVEEIDDSKSIAVVIGFSRDVLQDVKSFISEGDIKVGKILYFKPETFLNQFSVNNGSHAMALAQYVASEIQNCKAQRILLFPACPGSVCFMLGQLSRPLGQVTMFEFDFEKTRTYFPTYTFN